MNGRLQNVCAICDDCLTVLVGGHPEVNASALPCGHVFHTQCISKWFNCTATGSGRNNLGTCPHCRSPLPSFSYRSPSKLFLPNYSRATDQVTRLFIDSVDQDDPIKAEKDLLQYENGELRDRLAATMQNNDELSKLNSSIRGRVAELEQMLLNKEWANVKNGDLTLIRIKLYKKSEELKEALEEVTRLRQRVSRLRAFSTTNYQKLSDDEFRGAMEDLNTEDMGLLLWGYKKDRENLDKEVRKLKKELAETRCKLALLGSLS